MSFIVYIFNEFLYRPLINVLVLLYVYLPGQDFGVAIIVLTILIKLILYPLGSKAIKSQKALAELQPKIKEIQEKYKDDREKQGREMLELYKREKISPFAGLLPLFIQLPVLIALYRVFLVGLDPNQFSSLLYGFLPHLETVKTTFLGIIDLTKPNAVMVILTGVFQFLQIKLISTKTSTGKTKNLNEQLQKQMQYIAPLLIIFILWSLPSALGLYILTTTVFTIIQQYIIVKKQYVK